MPDDNQVQWLQDQINTARQAGLSNEDIQSKILAKPELASIYGRMPPIVPRSWGEAIGREARLGAESFARGIPSVIAAPGNVNQLLGEQFGIPQIPYLPTSETTAGWEAAGERALFGAGPLTPQTPAERLYAGAMEGLGASAVPGGAGLLARSANLATRAAAGGVGGGLAATATREYAPGLGPWAPMAAGMVAGSVLGGPAFSAAEQTAPGLVRNAQNVGARAGIIPAATGPRTYTSVLNNYGANPALWPTQNVIPPGITKTNAGNQLRAQFDLNLNNPAARPGTGGVPGTNLDAATVNQLQGKSGGPFLKEVEENPSIAAEFAASPTMQPHMRTAASANLALNANRNVPRLDQAGTLEHFYGADAPIVRQQHTPTAQAPTTEADILRLIRTETITGLGPLIAGGVYHLDPTLTAALTTVGATIPLAARYYTRYPQAVGGMAVGGAIGGATGLEAPTSTSYLRMLQ